MLYMFNNKFLSTHQEPLIALNDLVNQRNYIKTKTKCIKKYQRTSFKKQKKKNQSTYKKNKIKINNKKQKLTCLIARILFWSSSTSSRVVVIRRAR